MEKGVHKYWGPDQEAFSKMAIEKAPSFADRFMLINMRNTLKYDHRTRESKKATARLRLMLATATDEDLKELGELHHKLLGDSTDEKLEDLIELREEIRANGVPRYLIGA